MGALDNEGYEGYVGENDYSKHNNNTQSQEEPEHQMTEKERKRERFLIYKNVLLISVSFLLLFVAFESMSKLQSSINKVKNLGTWANAMVYLSLILSCMFLPSILIKRLKVKWTLVICVFCYSTYMAAQFKPEFYTLLPTAFVLGLGAAPMWSAKCTYLTQIATRMAALNREDSEPYIVKFFGIFFFFFQCNSIVGNIISTAVLSQGKDEIVISDDEMLSCGANYCPDTLADESSDDNSTDDGSDDNFQTDKSSIYTLAGIYLACSLCAALVLAVFLDPLTRFGEEDRKKGKQQLTGMQLLVATFRHMKNKKQLLIIPLTIWSGIEQGFFGADFTAGFVTCAYGVHIVGRVLICYGIFDAIASASFGFVIKVVGRWPIFVLGAVINMSVLITLFLWTPTNETWIVVYVLAAFWGIGDAIWQTQINALYGVLFASEEEAAFSNYRLWESFGFFIAFIIQASGVCVFPKMILAMCSLLLGMIGYFLVEMVELKEKNK